MEILGPKSGTGLVVQAFVRNLGGLVAPQLITAFINQETYRVENWTIPSKNFTNFSFNTIKYNDINMTDIESEGETVISADIEYSYGIVGLLLGIGGIIFTIFFIFERSFGSNTTKPVQNLRSQEQKTISPSTCRILPHGKLSYFLILLNFMNFNIVGIQFLVVGYIYSYSLEGVHQFSPTDSAYINSAYFLSSIAGLAMNTVAINMFSVKSLLPIEVLLNVLTSVVLVIWGNASNIIFIIFSCLSGFFISSLDPLTLAWGNLHVKITVVATGFLFLSTSCGAAFYSWLASVLINEFSYYMYLILILCGNLLAFISYLILQIWIGYFWVDNKYETM